MARSPRNRKLAAHVRSASHAELQENKKVRQEKRIAINVRGKGLEKGHLLNMLGTSS
jgi:hypothetical protein